MSDNDLTCSGCGEYVGSHISDRIRELEALLDECERAMSIAVGHTIPHAGGLHMDVYLALQSTLDKLRAAQENADEVTAHETE